MDMATLRCKIITLYALWLQLLCFSRFGRSEISDTSNSGYTLIDEQRILHVTDELQAYKMKYVTTHRYFILFCIMDG